MKIFPIQSFLFLFLFLFSTCSYAVEDFRQGGFKYSIIEGNSIAISDAGFDDVIPISEDSTLVIPSSVTFEGDTYYVERIKREAFAIRPEIKHLVINEGVKYIEPYAFFRCPNLQSVYIPSTFVCAPCHDEGLFIGCSNLCSITVDERNEEFDSRDNCNAIISTEDNTLILGCYSTKVPPTVTTIGHDAFRQCQKLERIILPEGVKKIEYCAFKNCPNLKEVSLPNTLDSLGGDLFEGCMSLTSITIPRGVSKISSRVFSGCHTLQDVKVSRLNRIFDSRNNCNAVIDSAQDTLVAGCGSSVIVEGIKGIGAFAFANSSLRSIKIPRSVRTIGSRAFSQCRFCNTIEVHPKNPVYNSKNNCNAIIETATGKLVQGCSLTCLADGVTDIGDYAFWGIPMPSYLVIPEGVEVIGERAFSRFNGIAYVQMPTSLKLIKQHAFAGCDGLYYVDLSRCSPRIEEFAFSGCSSLRAIDFSPIYGKISETAFANSPCYEMVKKLLERKNDKGF